MKRWALGLLLAAAAAAAVWLAGRKPAAPESPFAKAKRGALTSVLATNGRTEPLHWAPAHSERAGRVSRVLVERGQRVAAGAALVQLDHDGAGASLASALARLEQARTDLAAIERGGRAPELAEIDGAKSRLLLDRDAAARELATLQRLAAKKAATQAEVNAMQDRLASLDSQIAAQQARRAALVGPGEAQAAKARVADAEAAVALARRSLELATVHAPCAGVVYDLPARAGGWLNAGDLVARIGETSRLKVIVFVDEPDLGQVARGLPVAVTWDALPARTWQGVVEQPPSQVVALGARQVGEVATIVENPQQDLPPGANINARVRLRVVDNALTIPKSALRREGGEFGVLVLEGGRLAWRRVRIGLSSESQAEILEGLHEGASVALPSERTLAPGMAVTPVFP
ncbi:MAG: efflux RND transporter periplasmic adaptor subunit [Candidatus Solibacter usitatus]|nr:efflux RND transporter periplasmic adaptor subunit [Candidatus Solibacter usitatus]